MRSTGPTTFTASWSGSWPSCRTLRARSWCGRYTTRPVAGSGSVNRCDGDKNHDAERSRVHVARSRYRPGWRTVRCPVRTEALPSGHAGRLSLGKRTGFHGCGAFDNAATQLLETTVLTALPIEKNVITPVGPPRTARRRREQRPTLIPAPVVTFADLGVPAPVVAALGEDGIT